MAKGMFKQERFSFRKMKVGLASVAILFAFAQLGQVSADETSKVSSSEITKVTEAPKVVEEVKSPIEEAKAEIATEKSRPIVKETEAKAGDLIDVSKKESAVEVKESQEGNQKVHIETSVAEVTKTEIALEKMEKIPEPVTTTKENSNSSHIIIKKHLSGKHIAHIKCFFITLYYCPFDFLFPRANPSPANNRPSPMRL